MDLRVLTGRELRAPFFVGSPRRAVLRVGAAVLDQLTFVEVEHARDGLVEELDVVADDEERAAVVAQEPHEPLLGVDVEVVGRLVEHQEVAAREEDARQLHPAALATRERVNGHVEAIVAQAQPGRDPADLRLGRVPTEAFELLLRVGEPPQVLLRRVFVDLAVALLEPLRDHVEALARQDMGDTGRVDPGAVGLGVLGEVADPLAA